MSRYIATRAISGAQSVVAEAELLLEKALAERGPDAPAAFPNTAYHLPLILGMTGHEVDKLGDLPPILQRARSLLHPVPTDRRWTPYLGETLDAGMATLLAEETIEAIRFIYGAEPQPGDCAACRPCRPGRPGAVVDGARADNADHYCRRQPG